MVTEFHQAALTFMLDHPDDQHLVEQVPFLSLARVKHTGVGCFYTYEISSEAPLKFDAGLECILNLGKMLYARELTHGASVTLFITEGKINCLEVLAHGDPYPATEPTDYRFVNEPYNIIDQRDNKNT